MLWFNKEAFDQLLWSLFVLAVIDVGANPLRQSLEVIEKLLEQYAVVRDLQRAGQEAEYQVEKLLETVTGFFGQS